MNTHFVGESALLLDTDDARAAQRLCWSIRRRSLRGIRELVPAYDSLLVEFDAFEFDETEFFHLLPSLTQVVQIPDITREHEIPVIYDGEDLPEVASLVGMDTDEVIHRHSSATYTVAFIGFAPGFPYLTGLDPRLRVPRLRSPRIRVAAGAVAVVDEFSGIYPQSTPGGWRILGRTDTRLFDPDHAPPSLFNPGDQVRFRPAR